MTVHGGPTFTQWQQRKLQPNIARSMRNLNGDLIYTVFPTVIGFMYAAQDALTAFIKFSEKFLEKVEDDA